MSINKERLEFFYSISNQWMLRDQRFLAAIGFELELAEHAFSELVSFCERHTDAAAPKWHLENELVPNAAIMVRAFVDHSARAHKLLRGYIQDDEFFRGLTDEFFDTNRALFDLRNALHHADERIHNERSFELTQPLCGDFSWLVLNQDPSIDLYWLSFGPMIGGEVASPAIDMEAVRRRGINEIRYRAYDIEIDIASTAANLSALAEAVHDELVKRFDAQMERQGIVRGGLDDIRIPGGLKGRARISGVEVSERKNPSD